MHGTTGQNEPNGDGGLRRYRKRFALTAVAGAVAFVGYAIQSALLLPEGSGTGAKVSGVIIIALLLVCLAGLLGLGVTTLKLQLRGASTTRFSNVGAGPPDRFDNLIFRLFYAAMVIVGLFFVPAQIDSVAYLADQAPQGTFVPKSYGQACGKYGCTTDTIGIIEPGEATATWKTQVPLGKPFQVAVPLWAFGLGYDRAGNAQDAIENTVAGLLWEWIAGYAIIYVVVRLRRRAGESTLGVSAP
jgi:hypothetical protein